MFNIAVGVSGGGRSLENLLEYQLKQESQHSSTWRVACVFSSRDDCRANDVARANDLPLYVGNFSKDQMPSTRQDLQTFFQSHDVDIIALAGFLKPFPCELLNHDRIKHAINIHPALLPKFGGKGMYGHHVHEAVFKAQEKVSGATIHFVTSDYDEGAIISQMSVDISLANDAKEIASKVFQIECHLLPKTLDLLSLGKLPLPDKNILFLEQSNE